MKQLLATLFAVALTCSLASAQAGSTSNSGGSMPAATGDEKPKAKKHHKKHHKKSGKTDGMGAEKPQQ